MKKLNVPFFLLGVGVIAGIVWFAIDNSKRDSTSAGAPATGDEPDDGAFRRAIPRSDLPPEGTRSLFDHILKENGGLPFPFDELLELVARYDAEGRRPATVLVPDGRSLLKAQASFAKPRLVTAADVRSAASDADLGMLLRGRLFFGFVEDAREIEVISYNEAAGRFEFQLVRDYFEGGVPRITYAKRSLCTSCHQGEAPIFPVRPWDETNAQPAIAERILRARGVARASGAEYFGTPIVGTLENAETIDDLVGHANIIAATQRIWIDGCGEDAAKGTDCRRQMLVLALRFLISPADVSPEDPDAKRLALLQGESWPKHGIGLANSSLRNRNPSIDGSSAIGMVVRLKGFLLPDSPKPADLSQLAPVRPDLDPLRPRAPRKILAADSLDGVYGVAELLGPNDRRLLENASGGDRARLEHAVRADRLTPLLGPRPFRRVPIVKALLAELGVKRSPTSSEETTEGMSVPLAEGGKALEIAAGSPLAPFERYCFACHRGNPAARLDFMSGDSEEEVLAKIKQVSAIRDVLDYERYLGTKKEGVLMPPSSSYQRRDLDRARASGKDDVKRMVAVIPGLFE